MSNMSKSIMLNKSCVNQSCACEEGRLRSGKSPEIVDVEFDDEGYPYPVYQSDIDSVITTEQQRIINKHIIESRKRDEELNRKLAAMDLNHRGIQYYGCPMINEPVETGSESESDSEELDEDGYPYDRCDKCSEILPKDFNWFARPNGRCYDCAPYSEGEEDLQDCANCGRPTPDDNIVLVVPPGTPIGVVESHSERYQVCCDCARRYEKESAVKTIQKAWRSKKEFELLRDKVVKATYVFANDIDSGKSHKEFKYLENAYNLVIRRFKRGDIKGTEKALVVFWDMVYDSESESEPESEPESDSLSKLYDVGFHYDYALNNLVEYMDCSERKHFREWSSETKPFYKPEDMVRADNHPYVYSMILRAHGNLKVAFETYKKEALDTVLDYCEDNGNLPDWCCEKLN